VKFLYKINSGYDGFRPARIPARLDANGRLALGWSRYIDAVEDGSEVWVYFKGPAHHRFEHGVYVKGEVDFVDVAANRVLLGNLEYSIDAPLTDAGTSAQVATAVGTWYRQVFIFPEELEPVAVCTVGDEGAPSCAERRCRQCATWRGLPIIQADDVFWPERLDEDVEDFIPGYWVLPPRNFLYYTGRTVRRPVRQTSELFYRFKTGEQTLAFPLALAIAAALREQDAGEFDCIIPIPLSPEKEQAGEIHRTRLLSVELGQLLEVPVRELLTLDRPISKRALMRDAGLNEDEFEAAYRDALDVDDEQDAPQRALLVDDVCTKGSTLTAAYQVLQDAFPGVQVVAVTAGQMTVRAVVRDADSLLE
jgi:predicted amidophosphoribosyltransferase